MKSIANLALIIFLSASWRTAADWRDHICLIVNTNALSIDMPECTISKVSTGMLQSENKDGAEIGKELYLIKTDASGYPIIEDHFPASSASLTLTDLDRDQRNELLVYYDTGANQYGVRIYRISSDRLIPLNEQPVSSNMRSVTVQDGTIVIENQEFMSSGEIEFTTTKYRIAGDHVVIASSESELMKNVPSTVPAAP